LIETPKGIEPQEIAAPTNQQEDNTMSISEMERKARELRELQALIEEATAEVEALKDAIKAAMGDSESVQAGEYRITYKAVTTARIDTAALKKALPDLAQQFTKTTTTRRFCVA
jgi:predicted phage-related endonuclease